MKRKWLIAAGMLLSFALTTHAQDKNFHIYLCIGQSNMVGAAKVQPVSSRLMQSMIKTEPWAPGVRQCHHSVAVMQVSVQRISSADRW